MWTTDIPTQEGNYWFYGALWLGQMEINYTDEKLCKPELVFVKIMKASNGLIGVAKGCFVSLRKFDRNIKSEGLIGYWKPVNVPKLPEDIEGLFNERRSNI